VVPGDAGSVDRVSRVDAQPVGAVVEEEDVAVRQLGGVVLRARPGEVGVVGEGERAVPAAESPDHVARLEAVVSDGRDPVHRAEVTERRDEVAVLDTDH
jgi:hypothetical protein